MAGAAIELDVSELLKANGQLVVDMKRLASADQRQLLGDLGTEVEGQTQERFDSQSDPDGRPWQPWSPSYAARRAGDGGSILRRGGDLQGDVSRQVEGDQVEVGARKVYAAPHQHGWPKRNIPRRQFLGFSVGNVEELGMLVEDFVRANGGLVA